MICARELRTELSAPLVLQVFVLHGGTKMLIFDKVMQKKQQDDLGDHSLGSVNWCPLKSEARFSWEYWKPRSDRSPIRITLLIQSQLCVSLVIRSILMLSGNTPGNPVTRCDRESGHLSHHHQSPAADCLLTRWSTLRQAENKSRFGFSNCQNVAYHTEG